MKCPYPECQKDYNDEHWDKAYNGFVNPDDFGGSWKERLNLNRLFLISRHCRFCHQYFHEVFMGHETDGDEKLEFLAAYPSAKTTFEATKTPKTVRDYFNEAERCRSIGSLTGTGACLRKAVYALCDDANSLGRDYREKITNLPVRTELQELLKQIKWLGDNVTKPGPETYSLEMVDAAIEILPLVVDELYAKDERMEKASKILAKALSSQPPQAIS